MQQELWRVGRAAKALDVSTKRVYHMVQEGKLNAVRLGPRMMRITHSSIRDFIEKSARENRIELGILEKRGRRPVR